MFSLLYLVSLCVYSPFLSYVDSTFTVRTVGNFKKKSCFVCLIGNGRSTLSCMSNDGSACTGIYTGMGLFRGCLIVLVPWYTCPNYVFHAILRGHGIMR
jgi:hypothetical protein